MRAGLLPLLQVLRHAVLGVAVLAVVLTAFGVHGHVTTDETTASCCLDDAPAADPDQDVDDHCHCPPPAAMTAEVTPLRCASSMATMERTGYHSRAPNSLNYPPDPPPVRLN